VAAIVVGDDGRAEAGAARDAAIAVARATGARLRIVEVIGMLLTGAPGLMGGPGYAMPPSDLVDRARRRLAAVAEQMPAGIAVETTAIVADAERTLVEESERADLVIVGSRGYGPHRAVLLGSVSGRLVRDAACPVLVVPRGVEAPLAGLFPAARAEAV
jgi:nucleotide-binding universal stress UspA family protein